VRRSSAASSSSSSSSMVLIAPLPEASCLTLPPRLERSASSVTSMKGRVDPAGRQRPSGESSISATGVSFTAASTRST